MARVGCLRGVPMGENLRDDSHGRATTFLTRDPRDVEGAIKGRLDY